MHSTTTRVFCATGTARRTPTASVLLSPLDWRRGSRRFEQTPCRIYSLPRRDSSDLKDSAQLDMIGSRDDPDTIDRSATETREQQTNSDSLERDSAQRTAIATHLL